MNSLPSFKEPQYQHTIADDQASNQADTALSQGKWNDFMGKELAPEAKRPPSRFLDDGEDPRQITFETREAPATAKPHAEVSITTPAAPLDLPAPVEQREVVKV